MNNDPEPYPQLSARLFPVKAEELAFREADTGIA
jgi:hypothetical protein